MFTSQVNMQLPMSPRTTDQELYGELSVLYNSMNVLQLAVNAILTQTGLLLNSGAGYSGITGSGGTGTGSGGYSGITSGGYNKLQVKASVTMYPGDIITLVNSPLTANYTAPNLNILTAGLASADYVSVITSLTPANDTNFSAYSSTTGFTTYNYATVYNWYNPTTATTIVGHLVREPNLAQGYVSDINPIVAGAVGEVTVSAGLITTITNPIIMPGVNYYLNKSYYMSGGVQTDTDGTIRARPLYLTEAPGTGGPVVSANLYFNQYIGVGVALGVLLFNPGTPTQIINSNGQWPNIV